MLVEAIPTQLILNYTNKSYLQGAVYSCGYWIREDFYMVNISYPEALTLLNPNSKRNLVNHSLNKEKQTHSLRNKKGNN